MRSSAITEIPKLSIQGVLGEVALSNPTSRSLLVFTKQSGAFRSFENMRAYDACGRYSAVVSGDGTLGVISGDPDFTMPQESDYVSLEVNTRSLFALRDDGTVAVKGECAFEGQVAQWRSVRELAAGEYHLAALMSDGTVRFASSDFALDVFKKSPDWTDIVHIASCSDCTLAVTSQGTVCFAGSDKDPRGFVSGWSDVVAVAVDDGLAVGLTSDGYVLLAGRQDIFKEYGCLDAGSWSDVVAVTCGRACVMGIDGQGELLLAGSIPFGGELIEQWPAETVRHCVSG